MNVSVLIPALNETENLKILLPLLKKELNLLTLDYEIIIIEYAALSEGARLILEASGARVIRQTKAGFGSALREGFKAAQGEFIITMDADLSHEPNFVKIMWDRRQDADMIIASRYVSGGSARMGPFRRLLSKILNKTFAFVLSLKFNDLSSGFRMYRKAVLDSVETQSKNFDILQEILLKIYGKGWKIMEVPFEYQPRRHGKSHARLFKFGKDYLKTLLKMWQLRNSIYCADYDVRAFYSKIFLQRYWQRKRHSIILNFVGNKKSFLDVGCGSSKIIIDNPDSLGLDMSLDKLRYLRSKIRKLVNADAGNLPFKDCSFNRIVCSELIEHCANRGIISELSRVLNKGGLLILGTPDYDKLTWRVLERMYSFLHKGGYADQHITHYTFKELKNCLESLGFKILKHTYICNAELIIKAEKI